MRTPTIDTLCHACDQITPHDVDNDTDQVYCLWCKHSEPTTSVEPPHIPVLRETNWSTP